MTAKEYLGQVQGLKYLIECRKREIEYWKDIAQGISASNCEPHYNATRNTSASYVNAVEKVVCLQQELNEKIIELVDLCKKINVAIDAIPSVEEQIVLRYRYLENYTRISIGAVLKQSERNVYRIHNNGLKHFSIPE